jgi:hypothetical protein
LENGHVTRAELAAHLGPMQEDVRELRDGQDKLRSEMQAGFAKIADSQWLGPQGRTFLSGAGLVGAAVAILIAALH